jgi:hypothetical protein
MTDHLTTIDGRHLLGDLPPFWVIARPWELNPKDLTSLERQSASQAEVKAKDYGCGLVYESEADATRVAALMSVAETGCSFFIVGGP